MANINFKNSELGPIPNDWEVKAVDLADRFIKNFVKYESNEAGKALVKAGPTK